MSIETLGDEGYLIEKSFGKGGNHVFRFLECDDLNTSTLTCTGTTTVTGAASFISDVTITGDMTVLGVSTITGLITATSFIQSSLVEDEVTMTTTRFDGFVNTRKALVGGLVGTIGPDALSLKEYGICTGFLHTTSIDFENLTTFIYTVADGDVGMAKSIEIYSFPNHSIICIHAVQMEHSSTATSNSGANIRATYGIGTEAASGEVRSLTTSTWTNIMPEKKSSFDCTAVNGRNQETFFSNDSSISSGLTTPSSITRVYLNVAYDFVGATFECAQFRPSLQPEQIYIVWSILS